MILSHSKAIERSLDGSMKAPSPILFVSSYGLYPVYTSLDFGYNIWV